MTVETWVAIGTGLLAMATFVLAGMTAWNVSKTGGLVTATEKSATAAKATVEEIQRDRELAHRPLLGDPKPSSDGAQDDVQFGAPGREFFRVPIGTLWINGDGTRISLPFRNVGSGAAVITRAATDPQVDGDVYVSRKFVLVGEHVRVNITRAGNPGSEVPVGQWWAMKPFAVVVHYTDASGGQRLVSRAVFEQYATQGPFVATISIFKEGEPEPFVVGKSSV